MTSSGGAGCADVSMAHADVIRGVGYDDVSIAHADVIVDQVNVDPVNGQRS